MRIGAWYGQGMMIWGNMNHQWNAASKALERLSTGYRINRAGDDPAGLAISEKMCGQISGLNMASKNISQWFKPQRVRLMRHMQCYSACVNYPCKRRMIR